MADRVTPVRTKKSDHLPEMTSLLRFLKIEIEFDHKIIYLLFWPNICFLFEVNTFNSF